jgi:O-antigen/teichoic acid export membrane protein
MSCQVIRPGVAVNNSLRELFVQNAKVKSLLFQWGEFFGVLVKNAGALVATQAVTSAFGFLYWWLAARSFPPQAVGLASASISAMTLLGTIGIMGFGTLLMGVLRREPNEAGNLIASAIVTVCLVGILIGFLFIWVISWIGSDLKVWSAQIGYVLLFASSVGLTSIVLVIDQALIGLLLGSLQLWRNTIFALVKLVALFAVSLWVAEVSGITIYITWVIGNLLSLGFLIGYAILKGKRISGYRPKTELIRKVGLDALIHHSLNIVLQVPELALPVVVTIVLSARLNAYFYASWMIASFVLVGPTALGTVLYAVGSADTENLAQKFRFTFKLSLVIGLIACAGLLIIADPVLRLFGQDYARQAAWCLRVLSLAVFPIIIKSLYVAIHRIHSTIIVATRLVILGSFLELLLGASGGFIGGIVGLSTGWVMAVFVEGLIMARSVYQFIYKE